MRISEGGKITPRGAPQQKSKGAKNQSCKDEGSNRIWQELAPRLIHPTKIELIEALSWIGEPLTVTDFFALLAPAESSIDYLRYHLKQLDSAEVVVEVPDQSLSNPDERRYWFSTPPGAEDSSERAGVAG